jgi:prophage antirepressor-like protein
MTALVPFLYEDTHLVRTFMRAGAPWFVLADVCRALEIGNPSDVAARLDDDERDTLHSAEGIVTKKSNSTSTQLAMTLDSVEGHSRMTLATDEGHSGNTLASDDGIQSGPGGARSWVIVNESGLYSLILTSRKPAARRFKKWVTGTVLPSIRKSGGYSTGREKAINPAADRHVIQLARELKAETDPTIRGMLHQLLEKAADHAGIAAPPIEALGSEAPPPPPILTEFWAAIGALQAAGIKVNHSPDPDLVALNLPELAGHVAAGRLTIPIDGDLRRALRRSTAPLYVAVRTVRSRLVKSTVRCWVFRVSA